MTLDLRLFRRGWFTIEAVQLTRENLSAVFEWADSKPFFGPAPAEGEPMPVTGLTVFEPTGRRKANFGDWIYKTPGGSFRTRDDAAFRELFQPVEEVAR
jgi:hypothetical protein